MNFNPAGGNAVALAALISRGGVSGSVNRELAFGKAGEFVSLFFLPLVQNFFILCFGKIFNRLITLVIIRRVLSY